MVSLAAKVETLASRASPPAETVARTISRPAAWSAMPSTRDPSARETRMRPLNVRPSRSIERNAS